MVYGKQITVKQKEHRHDFKVAKDLSRCLRTDNNGSNCSHQRKRKSSNRRKGGNGSKNNSMSNRSEKKSRSRSFDSRTFHQQQSLKQKTKPHEMTRVRRAGAYNNLKTRVPGVNVEGVAVTVAKVTVEPESDPENGGGLQNDP
ncbi:hypothetical protein RUM43_012696 [Polyplax serrata]|uniref:Uncharacterized protein n=1 Tax=Polyplax serrata TaxID=468196 RepID=A0AAN8S9P8_POLSC